MGNYNNVCNVCLMCRSAAEPPSMLNPSYGLISLMQFLSCIQLQFECLSDLFRFCFTKVSRPLTVITSAGIRSACYLIFCVMYFPLAVLV